MLIKTASEAHIVLVLGLVDEITIRNKVSDFGTKYWELEFEVDDVLERRIEKIFEGNIEDILPMLINRLSRLDNVLDQEEVFDTDEYRHARLAWRVYSKTLDNYFKEVSK